MNNQKSNRTIYDLSFSDLYVDEEDILYPALRSELKGIVRRLRTTTVLAPLSKLKNIETRFAASIHKFAHTH